MARALRWLLLVVMTAGSVSTVTAQDAAPPAPLPPAPQPSPLLMEPTTPEELFSAILLLVDLGRFDVASKYMTQFEADNPPDELLLKLRDQHGTGAFVRLSRIPDLQPAGKSVMDRLNKVAQNQVDDPAFVEGMITRLMGTPTEREIAIRELRNAGPRAVPQMLRSLGAAQSPEQREAITFALIRMGRQVVSPLIGALESPNEVIRTAAIDGLQSLEAQEAIPFLWSLAFAEGVPAGTQLQARRAIAALKTGDASNVEMVQSVMAAEDLRSRAEALFTRREVLPAENEVDMTRTTWRWDAVNDVLVSQADGVVVASLEAAQRMAREALALSPERAELQRLMLCSTLAVEVHRNGWDKPLPTTAGSVLQGALTTGLPLLSDSLREALAWGRTDSAWALLSAMKQSPSRDLVRNRAGMNSPVIAALNYPDARIQFEAAMVVLRAEPNAEFSGARRVVEILRRALTDPGQPRGIIIDADRERATAVSGFLSEQGFEGLTMQTGKQGFTKAAELAGIDLVVVHINAVDWTVTQTMANLRADARTASIPIILYGPEDARAKMTRLVKRSGLTTYVGEAASADDFWSQARPFLSSLQAPPLTAEQRHEQRLIATYWLATIATSKNARLFDISAAEAEMLPLVDDEELAPNLIVALGTIPNDRIQSALTDLTLNSRLSLDIRTRAADQLAAHIQRFGLLLSKDEIRLVNAAHDTDESPVIQAVLAPVLGTFQPNAGLAGQRLQRLGTSR